jgi:acetolactate synthase I/III small subunit
MVAIGRGSRSIADRPLRSVTPEDVRAHQEGHGANGAARDNHNRTHRKQMSDHHG